MIADIAPGASVRGRRRVGGGLATDTFAFDLIGSATPRLIVKRYRGGDTTAALEWERLCFAQRVDLPVPEPVALDQRGEWFGAPALVMTRLHGRADVTPGNADAWLRQLAHALAVIHDTDTSGAAGALRETPYVESPGVTTRPRRPSHLVERSLEAIDRLLPRIVWEPVFTHGDLHPGNVIWTRGKLSGVVDWSGARIGSRWYEVAYCRADVALLLGVDAADRLTRHYVTMSGHEPVDLALFDLICGLRAREAGARWLNAYREQGRTDTARQFSSRATAYLRHALANLGG